MSAPPHPACIDVDELLTQCTVRRQRRSGPGGQHRNKVETAVVIVHTATGCVGEASERRSQEQNRQEAILRLRIQLAIEVRVTRDALSERWESRLRQGTFKVSSANTDFPALLAEALDVLSESEWNAATAAQRLKCSTSQLVKLLKLEHRALAQLNVARRALGLNDLK